MSSDLQKAKNYAYNLHLGLKKQVDSLQTPERDNSPLIDLNPAPLSCTHTRTVEDPFTGAIKCHDCGAKYVRKNKFVFQGEWKVSSEEPGGEGEETG